MIKLRAVTLKYKADDLNGPVCVRNVNLHTVKKNLLIHAKLMLFCFVCCLLKNSLRKLRKHFEKINPYTKMPR